MNAAGDCHDSLAARNQRPRLTIGQRGIRWRAENARVSKLPLNLFELVKSHQILRGADRRVNKRRAHRRLANLFKIHAIAGGGKLLKVLNNFGPTCEFAIVARTKAEHLFRRGNRFGLRSCGRGINNCVRLDREADEENREEYQQQTFTHGFFPLIVCVPNRVNLSRNPRGSAGDSDPMKGSNRQISSAMPASEDHNECVCGSASRSLDSKRPSSSSARLCLDLNGRRETLRRSSAATKRIARR